LGSIADLPGTTINFILAAPKDVAFWGSATAGVTFTQVADAQLFLNVDGTDYPGTLSDTAPLGENVYGAVVVQKKVPALIAGAHVAKLRAAGSANIQQDASYPTRLMVIY
jgi:hypothetical protein